MQQIIDNKLYDTETAITICTGTERYHYNTNDSKIALYKTGNGNYFFENLSSLEPCTIDDAKEYFKQNIDGKKNTYDEYLEEFKEEIEKA